MKKSSAKPDYGKIALIVIIVVIVIAIVAGLVYYFTRDEEPTPLPVPAPAPAPFNAKPPAKKPLVFLPPLFRERPEPKIVQPKVDVKVSTNKKKNNSNRATNLGLGYMLGASHEKMKEQQTQIEDLKCKQLHGSSARYNPYTKSCETGVDNKVSGNGVPTNGQNSSQTEPASNISGNNVSQTEPVISKSSNNLSNMNTVVNNLSNVAADIPVIGIQNSGQQDIPEVTQNTYNNRRGSYVFDINQGNFQVNNTHKDLMDIVSTNHEHNININSGYVNNSYANNSYANNSGYVNSGNSITVLPPGITTFEGSTDGNLSYEGMENSSVNGGIQNNLAVNGSGN